MFQLSFPQPEMLLPSDLSVIMEAVRGNAGRPVLQKLAENIRDQMNPHPANQKTANVPQTDGAEVQGMQHKYRETALFFPSEVCWLALYQQKMY